MAAFLTVAANVFLLLSAFGFGSLLRSLIPKSFSALDSLALVLLGGLGLQGTLLFCAGQIWFTRATIWMILGAGMLTAIRLLYKGRHAISSAIRAVSLPRIQAVIISTVLLITAIGGLAEPTGDIKMDEIAYHLLGPRVWLRDGIIRPVSDEALTAFPAVVETQYAALMSIGGESAPGFFALVGLLAMLLIAASLAMRFGLDSSGVWWTAALIITMPVVYRGAFGGFVDVIYSAFVLAALRLALDSTRLAHYVFLGAFCGFAMGTKYTGLIASVIVLGCLFFFASSAPGLSKKALLKGGAIACVVAIVVASPWYLRNWVLLGCPIYPPPPAFLRFFHPRYLALPALQHLQLRMWNEGTAMGRGPISFLLLPFHLTYHPANFINGAGGIGLAPIALAPFGLFACRGNRFGSGLVMFSLLQTVAWFVTAQEARYLIHGYVIAAIFAVSGWAYVRTTASRSAGLLSALLVATSVLYGLFMIGSARAEDLRAAVSPSFAKSRRTEEIPFLQAFEFLNQDPSVEKVLILNPRVPSYYLKRDYVKPVGRLGEETVAHADSLVQTLANMRSWGITHVLDVRLEGSSFRLSDDSPGLTLILATGDQRIYRVD